MPHPREPGTPCTCDECGPLSVRVRPCDECQQSCAPGDRCRWPEQWSERDWALAEDAADARRARGGDRRGGGPGAAVRGAVAVEDREVRRG